MSTPRTHAGLLLAAALMAAVSGARAEGGMSLRFAECVGRFSAEREHAWLMGGNETDLIDRQRAALLSLLEATPAEVSARRTMAHRIEAKMAHAALLRLATFDADEGRADRARRLAERLVGGCRGLLLGG